MKYCSSGLDFDLIIFWFSWGKWMGHFMGMIIDWDFTVLLGVYVF
jgi:hypothetical protein